MKQGTVSVLFGCHSLVHSLLVVVAWWKLYHSLPNWWELICILIHDIGHWGKDYLDDYESKRKHGELGASLAKFLFGQKGYDLVAGHNAYSVTLRSRLHNPDKYSWVISPTWWVASNSLFEPKLRHRGLSRLESATAFKRAMKENMDGGFKELGHDVYLRLRRGGQK